VHPRDNDLIVGTHGRSVYILDDVTPLQQLAQALSRPDATSTSSSDGQDGGHVAVGPDVVLFDMPPSTQWVTDVSLSRTLGAAKHFRGENAGPGTWVHYFVKTPLPGEVSLTIADGSGKVVRTLSPRNEAGLHRIRWNLRADAPRRSADAPAPGGSARTGADRVIAEQAAAERAIAERREGRGRGGAASQGAPVAPGTYFVKLSAEGREWSKPLVVQADPWPNQ
jgi:hypothetical protein